VNKNSSLTFNLERLDINGIEKVII